MRINTRDNRRMLRWWEPKSKNNKKENIDDGYVLAAFLGI